MQGRGDRDGVSRHRGDLQELPATTNGVTAGVSAARRRVFAALLQAYVISRGYSQTGDRGKAGSQFVGGGAQGHGRAVVGSAVAGRADGHDGSGGSVVDDSATASIHGDIGCVEGEL